MPERNLKAQLKKFCLLDVSPGNLESMLSDPDIALALTDFEESIALRHIDELFNLYEAPIEGLLLNSQTVKDLRDEWTIQIPPDIYNKLSAFVS